MHDLFATLLIHRGITDVSAIWDKFATNLYDNLPY